jgi:hypothetical protein
MNAKKLDLSKPKPNPGNPWVLGLFLLGAAAAAWMTVRTVLHPPRPKLSMPASLQDCVGVWEGGHWRLVLREDGTMATGFSIPLWVNLSTYQVEAYTPDEVVIEGPFAQTRYHIDVPPHITADRHLEMTVDGVALRRIQ